MPPAAKERGLQFPLIFTLCTRKRSALTQRVNLPSEQTIPHKHADEPERVSERVDLALCLCPVDRPRRHPAYPIPGPAHLEDHLGLQVVLVRLEWQREDRGQLVIAKTVLAVTDILSKEQA